VYGESGNAAIEFPLPADYNVSYDIWEPEQKVEAHLAHE
jgi:hypothetical protein